MESPLYTWLWLAARHCAAVEISGFGLRVQGHAWLLLNSCSRTKAAHTSALLVVGLMDHPAILLSIRSNSSSTY